jgi:hypothetical protein
MTTYLLVVFLLTPAFKYEYDSIAIAQYSSYEACEAAGIRATTYGKNYSCIPVMHDGKIP